ncbi:HAD hydrolase-like protein [Candidatus Uhrbacteria bacterium]|nr:HAD hydrolase-like protein [Candidatus Uhrbacteria bacterium]
MLFDVGNVIVRATHAITWAILEDYGIPPDVAVQFFRNEDYADFARGKLTGTEFANRLGSRHLKNSWLGYIELRAAHDAHIYIVDDVVVNLLDGLKMVKVPLAFVTTTNKWQTMREMQLIELEKRFGQVVRSHDIGKTKTDEGAWPVILKALHWQDKDPSAILLVDDALANCEAARRAGLQTHQYDPTPVVGVQKLRAALREHGLFK